MAKQKEEELIPRHIQFENGKVEIKCFLCVEKETNVNDIEFYKDQSCNPLFMSTKEDLLDIIQSRLKEYESELLEVKSPYKKELIQIEMDKFRFIETNFRNTWECLEKSTVIFNNGNVLSENSVKEVEEAFVKLRENAKENVLINILSRDKFINKYFKFLFLHPILHIAGFPFIAVSSWYIYSHGGHPLKFIIFSNDRFNFIVQMVFFYPAFMLIIMVLWFFIKYLNGKLLERIIRGKNEDKTIGKQLKKDLFGFVGTLSAFGIIKRILKTK